MTMSTTDRETDARLVRYIDALQTGDIGRIIEMRFEYAGDKGLKKRFATVETVHANLLELYAREIQIIRLELSGWKAISEGQETLSDEGTTPKERRAAHQKIYRGLERVERALRYRKQVHHSEIDLPKLAKIP